MAERPLIGLSPDQVRTNGMLGDLAFQDSNSAYIETIRGKVSLDKLDKSIEDTAVDIFVYDTRKDSDGGAWRKRTQHTSWYNETLNTSTRGSRREFPAVAVIVAETSKVTIYDGDDPDMPMWMVFNETPTRSFLGYTSPNVNNVRALNASLVVGSGSELNEINFLRDNSLRIGSTASWYTTNNISQRNVNFSAFTDVGLRTISGGAYSIAMTVLPNAPIDPDTGLPVPTIAVGTSGGISVIKDDGIIVDMTNSSGDTYEYTYNIAFTKDYKIRHTMESTNQRYYRTHRIPSSDYVVSQWSPDADDGITFFTNASNGDFAMVGGDNPVTAIEANSLGNGSGLTLFDENVEKPTESIVAYAATSYNTGWMHGDIKGAFLSDTDATNVTGNELVPNSEFLSNVGWTLGTGYSISGGLLSDTSSSVSSSTLSTPFALATGTHTLSYQATGSGGLPTIFVKKSSDDTSVATLQISSDPFDGVMTTTFNVSSAENYYVEVNGTVFIGTYDYISVIAGTGTRTYTSESDRSVNNKPLDVHGTITKTPVATGAELVGYRPPSGEVGDNYLSRPLTSSDFDLTSDWSITFWAKKNEQTANNYSGFEIAEDDLTGNSAYAQIPFSIYIDVSGNTGWRGANVTGYQYNTLFDTQDVWKCVTTISKSGNLYIYVNGEYVTSTPATFTNPSNPYSLGIFRFSYSESRHDGRRHIDYALFRMSNSAPSAEQIKKMYEDEKVLFQENAACTLYGSSDAVTALAYDDSTSILYAGTSSGRSDFQGLRRINNTTTAVTTAMSASNGLVAEQ